MKAVPSAMRSLPDPARLVLHGPLPEKHVSLVAFHRLLITAAILFCAGYGGYELVRFTRVSGSGSLLLGAVFLILAAGLSYYLWRLNRILGYEE